MIRAGMTLVETLVGMMLLGLLAVLGLSALGLVGHAGTAAAVDAGTVGAAQDLIRLRLLAALPLAGEGRAGRPALLFEGAADRLVFPVALPSRFGVPGPALVELRNGENGLMLFWRRVPDRADAGTGAGTGTGTSAGSGGEGASGRALIRDTAALRFRYFGSPRPADPPAWHAEWRDAAALPALVEVSAGFRDGDRRRWPPLVVAPRFANPPGIAAGGGAP